MSSLNHLFVTLTLLLLLLIWDTNTSQLRSPISSRISSSSSSSNDNCIFTDSLTGAILNLEELKNVSMTGKSQSGQYDYVYTPCANNEVCGTTSNPSIAMAQQSNAQRECWWIAKWDNGLTQPTYNPILQQWIFRYNNGMECPGNNGEPRNFIVTFVCDINVNTFKVLSADEYIMCEYSMTISTKYACSNIPPPECVWYNKTNVLNLNSLITTTISGVDDQMSDIIFGYTPCRNALQCDIDINDGMVMANLVNLTSLQCTSYLAEWSIDYNIIPSYNSITKVWQFLYQNGEQCGGIPSTFALYWICNMDITEDYKVISAALVAPCLYELQIASPLACN